MDTTGVVFADSEEDPSLMELLKLKKVMKAVRYLGLRCLKIFINL